MKIPFKISHTPLKEQLHSISFVPTNECLSLSRDRALRLTLLAAFKAYEKLIQNPNIIFEENTNKSMAKKILLVQTSLSNQLNESSIEFDVSKSEYLNIDTLRTGMIHELKFSGVLNPLLSIREGGIGEELFKSVSHKFLQSVSGICPATVSVVGALAAQEAIKACTHTLTPLNQLLMVESLDSLHERDGVELQPRASEVDHVDKEKEQLSQVELVYGKEIATELKSLRVLVVGAGAIGCELLKTLALMGVGEGIGSPGEAMERTDEKEEAKSTMEQDQGHNKINGLWADLKDGGIVVTDMDNIEKSNLNRQLLFR